jgi:hypothetical protein
MDDEGAGHAGLYHEPLSAREAQDDMLGATLHGFDPVASEGAKEAGLRNLPQDMRVVESGVGEGPSGDERPEVTNDGFDLRQLRHALPHAKRCPAGTVFPRT